ncbi:cadherin-like protein 26 [Cebidichthys violaceus]|uniref:cadherin-like protein 26 n=1 Tax=Cebidichthys violaceus TaxID=271503 RepID=UPI0035C98748
METRHLGLFLMLCVGVHLSSSETLKREKRNWIIDSFSIDEGYSGVFPYVLGNVEIEKTFPYFRIHGEGVDKEPKGVLQIDKHTGVISVYRPVDYEKYQVIKLTFQALDRESHAIDTQLGIEILIIDANDNAPMFDHDRYEISIKESTPQGTDLITVRATDDDRTQTFQLFNLQIVSVQPEPSDLEFFIIQLLESGTISFKGCLDHEKAEKYTLIVEAKGSGEGALLSSSSTVIVNIEDGNNHLPVVTGQTGSMRVKEGEVDVLIKRLQVTDEDSKGTAAWRAKYQIHGDKNKNFRIATDPETNEGLLYVEKHLDYEDSPVQNVTISVENEIPYTSCKVVERSATDLWEVNTETETLGAAIHRVMIAVMVENVNEPPTFHPLKKQVKVVENVEAGKYLVTFTATDPDITGFNKIFYKKGADPADWVKVDPKTGKISTTKIIDRESVFVKDNVYTVPILAVDNGQPPLTGTGTLEILISDENDNVPSLAASNIDMCQSDGLSLANITAVDPDEGPYSGPFTFKLQEQNKGKWKLDPVQGYSVNLVKEPTVPSGKYLLLLEVLDLQGERSVLNLSVTVCNCNDPARPNCHRRQASASFGGGGIGAALTAMLLLAVVLLLGLLLSCKRRSLEFTDGGAEQNLMKSNIENPGTDCKVFEPVNQGYAQTPSYGQMPASSFMSNGRAESRMSQSKISTGQMDFLKQLPINSTQGGNFRRSSSARWSTGASSRVRNQRRNSLNGTWNERSGYSTYQGNSVFSTAILPKALNMMLTNLEAREELGNYTPHVYAEEGHIETNFEPDALSIPDVSFDPDLDLNLDSNFSTLASICMPSPSADPRNS